jgi:hypothetical protein
VLGQKAGFELIAKTPKAAALVMQRTAKGTETAESRDWRRWVAPASPPDEALNKGPRKGPAEAPRVPGGPARQP